MERKMDNLVMKERRKVKSKENQQKRKKREREKGYRVGYGVREVAQHLCKGVIWIR